MTKAKTIKSQTIKFNIDKKKFNIEIKIVEKIQMRKFIFAFLAEKNISKRVNQKLKIRPGMKLSRRNKSFIFFCLSRGIEQKLGEIRVWPY